MVITTWMWGKGGPDWKSKNFETYVVSEFSDSGTEHLQRTLLELPCDSPKNAVGLPQSCPKAALGLPWDSSLRTALRLP